MLAIGCGFGSGLYRGQAAAQAKACVAAGFRYRGFGDDSIGHIGCPAHKEAPYMWKPFAILEAFKSVHDDKSGSGALWLDSPFCPNTRLPKFEARDRLGTHLYRHGIMLLADPPWTVGQWSTDACLRAFDMSREEAFRVPMIYAGAMGFDILRDARGMELMRRACRVPKEAYQGAWTNTTALHWLMKEPGAVYCYRRSGFCSDDPRVRGHRHDQTVLSILAHQMEIPLVSWSELFSYDGSNMDAAIVPLRNLENHGCKP